MRAPMEKVFIAFTNVRVDTQCIVCIMASSSWVRKVALQPSLLLKRDGAVCGPRLDMPMRDRIPNAKSHGLHQPTERTS